MNNIYEFPRHDQRYNEASEWIAKLDKGLSAADQEALQKWMAADQENQAVLLELASLWDKMGVLSRLSDLFPEAASRPSRSRRVAFATAVLITAVAGIWTVIGLSPDDAPDVSQALFGPDSGTFYETAIGEQSTVQLPDGTQLVLNTNSRVRVHFKDEFRLLMLEQGEFHVEVARDATRPLSVFVGDRIVKAIGTAFGLEIASDQRIELIVTEGRVLVGVQQSLHGRTAEVSPSVAVSAGEQITLGGPEEEDITTVSPEEIEIELSWRQGNLVFRGESLEDAVAEIGRYTTVEFVILDDDLKKVRIGGLYRVDDVDGLLATLRENFDVSSERTSDGKILLTSL